MKFIIAFAIISIPLFSATAHGSTRDSAIPSQASSAICSWSREVGLDKGGTQMIYRYEKYDGHYQEGTGFLVIEPGCSGSPSSLSWKIKEKSEDAWFVARSEAQMRLPISEEASEIGFEFYEEVVGKKTYLDCTGFGRASAKSSLVSAERDSRDLDLLHLKVRVTGSSVLGRCREDRWGEMPFDAELEIDLHRSSGRYSCRQPKYGRYSGPLFNACRGHFLR